MIDIHSHILPGIDDGAADPDEACAILEAAGRAGVRTIYATPHVIPGSYENDSRGIAAKLESLRREADKRHIEIEILSGAELYLVPDLPARLAADPGLMLSGSRCALIECPMQGIPPYADGVLSSLMESGVTPILAHPERNAAVMEDASVLMPFLCKGVFLQINAGSILGYYEKRVLRTVRELLERDMVHFIGSDAHGPGERSPSLSAAVAEAATWIGAQKAGQLVASQLMWP